MKKITALILSVCLILTLCACGETQVQTTDVQSRNEASAPSETPNTETKQEEPAQQQEETAQQVEPAPEQEAEEAEEPAVEEEETRGFTVEDFEIEEIDKNGTLKFKIKVRNNTDEDAAGFSFAYQLLDENSDSLYDASFLTHDILAGQAKWIGTIRVNESDYQGAVEIQFVRGELLGEGNKRLKPDNVLEERVKFPLLFDDTQVEEIETVNAEPEESQDDRITVEEIFIKKKSSNSIAVKVRNNDDEAHEIISLNIQILDSNGDLLEGVEPCVFNLDVDQAGKTEYLRINCDYNEIAAVKIIGFRYGTGSDLVRHFTAEKFKLDTPVIMSVEDITKE